MGVNDVELVRTPRHQFEHHEQGNEIIRHAGIEAQGTRPDGMEVRLRQAIARGEERDIVSEFHQCICQISDDTLRAAVQFRRYGFRERCDLCNSHIDVPSRGRIVVEHI